MPRFNVTADATAYYTRTVEVPRSATVRSANEACQVAIKAGYRVGPIDNDNWSAFENDVSPHAVTAFEHDGESGRAGFESVSSPGWS